MTVAEIEKNIRNGIRMTKEEGVFLLRNAEILDLGALANEIRFKNNPKPYVTYVLDTNPNYTNVCTVDCIFCAFYRHPGEEGVYTHTVDYMMEKFKEAARNGTTTVLLQGGVNPDLPFEYYLELLSGRYKKFRRFFRISFRLLKFLSCRKCPDSAFMPFWKNYGKRDCDPCRAGERKYSPTE